MAVTWVLSLLLVLVVSAGGSVGPSSNNSLCSESRECLQYELLCQTDEYEVRHYSPTLWVSTDAEAYFMGVGAAMAFRRLFQYITGANEGGYQMDMTAPVLVKIPEETTMWEPAIYTLSFPLPQAYQEQPPQPTNDKLYFTEMPDMDVYVRSYGGWMLSVTSRLQAHQLTKELDRVRASYNHSHHYGVGYDSPLKLLNRHNEVWYVSEGKPVCSDPREPTPPHPSRHETDHQESTTPHPSRHPTDPQEQPTVPQTSVLQTDAKEPTVPHPSVLQTDPQEPTVPHPSMLQTDPQEPTVPHPSMLQTDPQEPTVPHPSILQTNPEDLPHFSRLQADDPASTAPQSSELQADDPAAFAPSDAPSDTPTGAPTGAPLSPSSLPSEALSATDDNNTCCNSSQTTSTPTTPLSHATPNPSEQSTLSPSEESTQGNSSHPEPGTQNTPSSLQTSASPSTHVPLELTPGPSNPSLGANQSEHPPSTAPEHQDPPRHEQ
ncbi:hypothetical protein NQD34_000223 [Periophthalmus magnuspinnatus]|nr:hypothetical protein NQD34_000223 [Periophthalmus magnuspinnatus]